MNLPGNMEMHGLPPCRDTLDSPPQGLQWLPGPGSQHLLPGKDRQQQADLHDICVHPFPKDQLHEMMS